MRQDVAAECTKRICRIGYSEGSINNDLPGIGCRNLGRVRGLNVMQETPGRDRVEAFRNAFECPEYAAMVARLRDFTAQPQHRTIYLVGNHDSESGWNDPLRV